MLENSDENYLWLLGGGIVYFKINNKTLRCCFFENYFSNRIIKLLDSDFKMATCYRVYLRERESKYRKSNKCS